MGTNLILADIAIMGSCQLKMDLIENNEHFITNTAITKKQYDQDGLLLQILHVAWYACVLTVSSAKSNELIGLSFGGIAFQFCRTLHFLFTLYEI